MAHEMVVKFGAGYQVDVEYKGFTVRTDQPVGQGGGNTAPSPFDLFLVSLASCAGYFALAFCRERKIAVDDLHIFMSAAKTPGSKLVDAITIDVHLPADFPVKYREALVRAIDQCTVKAHLGHPPKVDIVVKTGAAD